MIIDLARVAAYICPFCSQVSIRPITLFKLNSSHTAGFACADNDCGEECIYISREKNKFKLEIECPICGDVHHFTTPVSSFASKPLLTYACPVSGVDIFFFGSREKVEASLEDSTKNLENMTGDYGGAVTELNLMYSLITIVHELISSQRISCRCHSHDIDCRICDSAIVLSCNQCGASMRIIPSEEVLQQLMSARSIVIDGN